MDSILIDYLASGEAFVLVGSGLSIASGYPTWKEFSEHAIRISKTENVGIDFLTADKLLNKGDYPAVFEELSQIIGINRLIQILNDKLSIKKQPNDNSIYKYIARWPIPIYMTTNYDDEILSSLTELNEVYITYNNSEDHLSYLNRNSKGSIFKLHGDLRSEEGLILTSSQYKSIDEDQKWQYWRTKLISIMQINPVIIIGHSLSDKNIKHVLEAAKNGAGINQPICWLAPFVDTIYRKEYLENYRIRIIPYDNSDGKHSGLLQLIKTISDFVPPRISIRIKKNIESVSSSPLGPQAGAPGLFVFNKILKHIDISKKRWEVIKSAILASLTRLSNEKEFTLDYALKLFGWPTKLTSDQSFILLIKDIIMSEKLFIKTGNNFKVNTEILEKSNKNLNEFNRLRKHFQNSLELRIQRDFKDINSHDAKHIAEDINNSLTGYFREGGLTLASTLFSSGKRNSVQSVPKSIVQFINESCTKYNNYQFRHAFFKASVDAFVRSSDPERNYLGRLSQGFFALHVFGLYGEEAIHKVQHIKDVVWLVDSDVQIQLLALAAPSYSVFDMCFLRLRSMGVRFYTTLGIADETWSHLYFACKLIENYGEKSSMVIASAQGDSPYYKSNVFLQGFINWQMAGNPCDWKSYLFQIFQHENVTIDMLCNQLLQKGIRVIDIGDWPGFSQDDLYERDKKIEEIVNVRHKEDNFEIEEIFETSDIYKKSKPEADTYLVIANERSGKYYISSEPGTKSSSYFISHTSIINLLSKDYRITWQPESFIRFTSNICPDIESRGSADRAFEILLFELAQSGVSVMSEDIIEKVFISTIDQTMIRLDEQKIIYNDTVAQKYGEDPKEIISRLRPSARPMAGIQLAYEMSQSEFKKRKEAEHRSEENRKKAKIAEKEANELVRFKKKLEDRKSKTKKRKRKSAESKSRKGKRNNLK